MLVVEATHPSSLKSWQAKLGEVIFEEVERHDESLAATSI